MLCGVQVVVNEEQDPVLVVVRLKREVTDLKAELRYSPLGLEQHRSTAPWLPFSNVGDMMSKSTLTHAFRPNNHAVHDCFATADLLQMLMTHTLAALALQAGPGRG